MSPDPCLGRNIAGFRHRLDEFEERLIFVAVYEGWPSWAERLKRLKKMAAEKATEVRRP